MPQTQPKPGHLRGREPNDVQKAGREVPKGQPKPGHLKTTSGREARPGGTNPNPLTTRGYGKAAADETPRSVRRIDDKVRRAEGGRY